MFNIHESWRWSPGHVSHDIGHILIFTGSKLMQQNHDCYILVPKMK